MALYKLLTLLVASLLIQTAQAQTTPAASGRPSFLIVVADDLGWSDLGATGGEIRTPALDSLAARGRLMTDFYVAPTCSPTRAMLLTGVDNHQAGVGTMSGMRAPNQIGRNYDAQLHDGVVTVSEILNARGYQTFLSGKWHLAVDDERAQPEQRGFDRSFTLLQGGASHFADKRPLNDVERPVYLEDGRPVELPDDFYSSIHYTDKLLEYLDDREPGQPFFAYLAYTAPHDPLQVPDQWLDRYAGAYDMGPVALREQRAERAKTLGLISESAALWWVTQPPAWVPLHEAPWSELSFEEQSRKARPMEIYAAMVELMDEQFGRVLSYLEETGNLENTYILFLSDNGASPATPLLYPGNTLEWIADNWPEGPDKAGEPGRFTVQSRAWASASNSPWRMYKGLVGDGGIRSPLIIAGPGISAGSRSSSLAHATDITPSLLELAGIDPHSDPLYEGKLAPQGTSLVSAWRSTAAPRSQLEMEHFGNAAVRRGNWKASRISQPVGSGKWELYDLSSDPGETRDLAEAQPDILAELQASFEAYVVRNGVIMPEPPPMPNPRQLLWDECNWWCEFKFKVMEYLPQPG